jgi:hypothetical protein
MNTLADAIAAEPGLEPPEMRAEPAPLLHVVDPDRPHVVTSVPDPDHVPIVSYKCEALSCRRWTQAHMLRDVRQSPAFGAARFVCDECEVSIGRPLAALIASLSAGP